MIRIGPMKHATLVGIYVLVCLLFFSGLLLVWSYDSAITAVDKELAVSFEKQHIILESILEKEMEQLDLALREILASRPVVDAIAGHEKEKAQSLILDTIDTPAGFHLDMVFVSLRDHPVWADASSSLFNLEPVLSLAAGADIPDTGAVLRLRKDAVDITLGLRAVPVVHKGSGRVLGRILGGVVLNDNLFLLNQIRDKTRSGTVLFFMDGDLIGATDPLPDPRTRFLTDVRQGLLPREIRNGNGLMVRYDFFRLSGRNTPLEVMTAISDTITVELKHSFRTKILSVFLLAVLVSLGCVWIINRLVHPSLDTLLTYCADVTSGKASPRFHPGSITELNQVGRSVETMVESLETVNTELEDLRNYLTNILDSMPSILVGIGKDGRVTQWNHGAVRATGFPADHALGKPLDAVFPGLAVRMERVIEAVQTRRTVTESKQARTEDGKTRYEDITIYPLSAGGVADAVIRVDDVTDQVHLEEMMIQSEKMLSVGGLAAGMAHEINNPLAGMIQTADVIRNRIFGDVPASRGTAELLGTDMGVIRAFMAQRGIDRMLETIHTSGIKAADIVSNMLSFARKGDAGKIKTSLTDLMDETLSLAKNNYNLKKAYDFKQIKIKKSYDPDTPMVPCEPGKIQQVFLNILINGAQAMFDYRFSAPGAYEPVFSISVRPARDGTAGLVEIRDNGPGMDDSVRKRVFEPFFTTKAEGEGTGLGLSVSYFIITENHNGDLGVVSAPGSGTTFTIRLPLDPRSGVTP